MEALEALEIVRWQGPFPSEIVTRTADALESGKLLYAPALHFELSADERRFLSPDCLDGKAKNITYRPRPVICGARAVRDPTAKN